MDREFGIEPEEAAAALQEAADIWDAAVGSPLFVHDPEEGFPIRLVHDERQEQVRERLREQEAIDVAGQRLRERRDELGRRSEAHRREEEAHAGRLRAYQRRVEDHNEAVRAWNERGGAPEETVRELQAVGDALEAERRALDETTRTIEAAGRALRDDVERLNRDLAEHVVHQEEVARAFPASAVEAGQYREAVTRENGRVVSVSREIRIYRFEDAAALRLVAAHELGHALGLGHADASGAVMSAAHERTPGSTTAVALHAEDLDLLRSRCPRLAG